MAGRGHQFGHIMQEAEIVSGSPSPSLSAARSRWDRMLPEAVAAVERIRTAEVVVEFPKGQWC